MLEGRCVISAMTSAWSECLLSTLSLAPRSNGRSFEQILIVFAEVRRLGCGDGESSGEIRQDRFALASRTGGPIEALRLEPWSDVLRSSSW